MIKKKQPSHKALTYHKIPAVSACLPWGGKKERKEYNTPFIQNPTLIKKVKTHFDEFPTQSHLAFEQQEIFETEHENSILPLEKSYKYPKGIERVSTTKWEKSRKAIYYFNKIHNQQRH